MRALFVTPYLPFPPTAGNALRTWPLLRTAAQRFGADLLTFGEALPEQSASEFARLDLMCRLVPRTGRSRLNRLAHLPDPTQPDLVGRMWSPAMVDALTGMLTERRYEVLQIEGLELFSIVRRALAHLPSAANRPALVYDAHNAEYQLQQRAFQIAMSTPLQWPAALYSLLQAAKLRRFEKIVCRMVDQIFAASDVDRRALERLAGVDAIVVPNAVDTEHYRPQPRPANKSPTLVFGGTMSYRPNVDAVCWFCTEIWPLVRREMGGSQLLIVGRDPAPAVRRLSSGKGIIVTGAVDGERSYYARADLFLVPMRFGGGARLKILQAMAMEVPVLSTTLGCEGIDLPGEAIRIADDGERFAAAAVALLRDKSGRRSLARAGRDAVVERYDWSTVAEPAVDALERLAARHPPPVPPKE